LIAATISVRPHMAVCTGDSAIWMGLSVTKAKVSITRMVG
jgi:hypothetical protein